MGMADAMVAKGLDKLGYIYVAIDCGWNLHTRDAKGDLQPEPKKFPDGIGAVARYVNGLGDGQLRLGLYSEHDTGDCCGGPGMKGHEDQDAAFYKANGIDYLKVDSCAGHTLTPRAMYNDFVSAAARARGPLDLSTSRPLDCAAGVRCWRALLACAAGVRCWLVLECAAGARLWRAPCLGRRFIHQLTDRASRVGSSGQHPRRPQPNGPPRVPQHLPDSQCD